MGHLGSGAMGEVVLAHDRKLGRDLAIKVLPQSLSQDAELISRLRHEARAASSLNHPNILTIYEIGESDGETYVAMEYLEGSTLREVIDAGALPLRKVLQIAAGIADGLAAAHRRELVHRDLKPDNIVITTDGVVKILDFGLAKTATITENTLASTRTSESGTVIGTFGYMAPEQARGQYVDFRADQFALGAILYEMLSGLRAFDGLSGIEIMMMVVRDEPPSLSKVAPHVPAPLRWIVERCLSKDAEDRYASTRDLARDLQDLRNRLSEASVAPVDARPEKKVRVSFARLAIVMLVVLAIGAFVGYRSKKVPPRSITSSQYFTYSGQDFSPAASHDGKLVAFTSNRDGRQRIWLKQVDGGGEVAVTEGTDDFPRISPDGSAILFARFAGRQGSLWRIPIVGGEARKILDDAASGSWSPDGKQIAFSRASAGGAGQDGSVGIANADGSGARILATIANVGLAHPRFSPDGTKIAIVGTRGRSAQLAIIVDVKDGSQKFLAVPPKAGEISSVVWSRDGDAVFYNRADSVEAVVGSTGHIYRHDIERDVATQIAWSPNNSIFLDVIDDGKLVLDARSPRDNLRTLPIGGSSEPERWITRGNSSDRQPVYAPDGKSIIFSSNRSGNLDLWQIDLLTGSVRRLTDDATEDWDPAFTPDGTKLVWSSGRSGHLEIWIAEADGSGARQVTNDGFDAENPSATSDGRWIVYNSFNPQKTGVWKIHPDGSGAERIVDGRTALPEVSPDGKYAVYIANSRTNRAALRVIRIEDAVDMKFEIPIGGASRRTTAIMGRARWMPDGKTIAFLGQDEEGINGVFVQDFVPGMNTASTRRPLGGFDPERATESFGISRDGKQLVVAGWEQLFSLMTLNGVPYVVRPSKGEKD